MQLEFYHFNKCAGTSILHFLHNRVAESESLHSEWLNEPASVVHCFDKKILHITATAPAVETPWTQFAMAVFREPIARAFSDYKMVTRWSREITTPFLAEVHRSATSGIIPFFKSQSAIEIGHYNHVTRTLAGPAFWDWFREVSVTAETLDQAPTDKLLERALSVLNGLDVVLTFNDLSPIGTLATALSKDSFAIPFDQKLNSFDTSGSLQRLTPEERQAIEAFNRLDIVVWDRVQQIVNGNKSQSCLDRFALQNDTTILDFSQSLPATNIWPRESNAAKHSVWTGNGGPTNFIFRKRTNSRKYFNFLVTSVLSSAQFEQMQIRVNGAAIPWAHRDTGAGFLVTAVIQAHDIERSDLIYVAIEVPLIPSPRVNDPRHLGIEISKASLIADWRGLAEDEMQGNVAKNKLSFFERLRPRRKS